MYNPFHFIFNDRELVQSSPAGKVTLDFIRQDLHHTGTKEGCREGECGACSILLGTWSGSEKKVTYRSVNSCLLPAGSVPGKHLVTIEGLTFGSGLNLIQQAFVDQGATQCGFCTPGFIISLTRFFLESETLTVDEGLDAVSGNICRCTGYTSIRRAIESLLGRYGDALRGAENRTAALVEAGFLPSYFTEIPEKLRALYEKDSGGKNQAERNADTGREEILVAGATDLLVQRPEALLQQPLKLIDGERGMKGITVENGMCRIGAGTPMEDLRQSKELAAVIHRIGEYMKLIASSQIRQRATVGGNLVNASPIGDTTVMFLGLDAVITLEKNGKSRNVALKDFYLGYKKLDLEIGEIMKEISFDIPPEGMRFNFEKVSKRTHLDIASVNSAARIELAEGASGGGPKTIRKAVIAAGGTAAVPLFLRKTCAFLEGKKITGSVLKQAAGVMDGEISPISDVRGSEAYKRLLLRQLFFAHFLTLFPGEIRAEEVL